MSNTRTSPRRHALRIVAGLGLLAALAACAGPPPQISNPYAGQRPSASVRMSEVQAAYYASGSTGQGMLFFRDRSHPFSIEGVGVGGFGASTIDAYGEVYNLRELSMFPGQYDQGRVGFAVGNISGGEMWLQNDAGVVMHLHAQREGVMLSLGADKIVITLR